MMKRYNKTEISVVIPVYGCRAALPELHRRLTDTLKTLSVTYEIILVDDCCPQKSWEIIEQIAGSDAHVKGLELSRNFGQMRAILAGLEQTKGNWVIVMDCDLQDRPEEIPRLYHKALEGYDIVFARRKNRKDGALKKLFSRMFYKLYNFATDGNYDGELSNFSIVKKNVVSEYCNMREEHRGYIIYLKWLGFRQATIDVEHDERFEGESSYSFKKRFDMAIDLLTSQSDKLLKLIVKLGFFISLLSAIAIIALVIFHYVADVTIGWTSVMASDYLIGGILMMIVGVVGIYVGKIFIQTKERPLFVIRQIKCISDEEDEEVDNE